MVQLAIFLALAVSFGVLYALVEWVFRRLTGHLASRLHAGWRWLALPLTALISWTGFVALRPLVLDQPPSVPVLIGSLTAVALLVITGTAAGWAVLQLLGIRASDVDDAEGP
jgi:hypothetical protein